MKFSNSVCWGIQTRCSLGYTNYMFLLVSKLFFFYIACILRFPNTCMLWYPNFMYSKVSKYVHAMVSKLRLQLGFQIRVCYGIQTSCTVRFPNTCMLWYPNRICFMLRKNQDTIPPQAE